MKNFVYIIILLFGFESIAQNKTLIEAPKNQNLFEVLSDSLQYVDSNFQFGKVYHADGKSSEVYLNYNLLLSEMHFVVYDSELKKNKILSIANPETIKFIIFGKHLFVYDDKYGYLEVLVNTEIKLLKKEKLVVKADDKSQGGYGAASESSGKTNVSYIKAFNTPFPIGSDGDITAYAEKEIKFYGMKSSAAKSLSSKKNLLGLFAKNQRTTLQAYLDSLNGKWNEEQHLIDFFKYADKIIKENK